MENVLIIICLYPKQMNILWKSVMEKVSVVHTNDSMICFLSKN